MNKKEYTKVWGDTVFLPELLYASGIGIASTMGAYGSVYYALSALTELSSGIISGYALMAGIAGCFLGGMIAGRSFQPKRQVIEGTEEMELEKILEEAGTTLEAEAKFLADADAETIREMEDLELYALLRLIPEDSPNYKPQYHSRMERGSEQ